VDFVAWAHYARQERGTTVFIDLIADKIVADYSI
jgi:hypothetical protein